MTNNKIFLNTLLELILYLCFLANLSATDKLVTKDMRDITIASDIRSGNNEISGNIGEGRLFKKI